MQAKRKEQVNSLMGRKRLKNELQPVAKYHQVKVDLMYAYAGWVRKSDEESEQRERERER